MITDSAGLESPSDDRNYTVKKHLKAVKSLKKSVHQSEEALLGSRASIGQKSQRGQKVTHLKTESKLSKAVTVNANTFFQNKANLVDDSFLFNAIVLEVVLNVQNQNRKISKVIKVQPAQRYTGVNDHVQVHAPQQNGACSETQVPEVLMVEPRLVPEVKLLKILQRKALLFLTAPVQQPLHAALRPQRQAVTDKSCNTVCSSTAARAEKITGRDAVQVWSHLHH